MPVGESVGIGSVVVALECMNWPFGSNTGIDGLVFVIGLVGSLDDGLSMKCPVAPVSAIISVVGADIALRNK